MRTRLVATFALAALLTVGGTALAFAQAADAIAATNQDVLSDQASAAPSTQNSNPGGDFSAHHHPYGKRIR